VISVQQAGVLERGPGDQAGIARVGMLRDVVCRLPGRPQRLVVGKVNATEPNIEMKKSFHLSHNMDVVLCRKDLLHPLIYGPAPHSARITRIAEWPASLASLRTLGFVIVRPSLFSRNEERGFSRLSKLFP